MDDKHGNDEEDEDAYGYELVYMVLAATAVAGRIRDLPVDNTIACCGILTRIVISAIGLGLATKTNANALFMMDDDDILKMVRACLKIWGANRR